MLPGENAPSGDREGLPGRKVPPCPAAQLCEKAIQEALTDPGTASAGGGWAELLLRETGRAFGPGRQRGARKEQAAGPLRMAAGPLVPWSGVYSEGDIVPMKGGSQETGHCCRGLSPCAGPAPAHACPRKSSRFQEECVLPGRRLRVPSPSAGRPKAQRSQLTSQVHKMVTVTRRVAWWGPPGGGPEYLADSFY